MKIELKYDLNDVDWYEATEIFKRAPLGVREPEKLRRAFENSSVVCMAYCSAKLVGMARAISDGEYQAAIYDLVLLPEFQRKGLGSQILNGIHNKLSVETIILYSVPGKEPFYENLGYHKMVTAMARKNNGLESFRINGYIV